MELTPRQAEFALLVATGEARARAAALAGYSARSAAFTASRLVKRPQIQRRIDELMQTARRILRERAQTEATEAALGC